MAGGTGLRVEMAPLNWLDVLLGTCIILAVANGARRGFVREGLAVLGLIGAGYVAGRFHSALAAYLARDPLPPLLAGLIAYVGILVAGLALATVVSSLLYPLARLPLISPVDHFGGALVGLLEATVLLGLVLTAASGLDVPVVQEAIESSSVARLIMDRASAIVALLPVEFGAMGGGEWQQ